MTRKNDLTALLPFPTRQLDATVPDDRAASTVSRRGGEREAVRRGRARSHRASTGRDPVQLDQLNLADMVRHHATRRAALRGADRSFERSLDRGFGDAVRPRGGLQSPPRVSIWAAGESVRQTRAVTVEGDTAGSAGDLCVGAVRRANVNFYLDLLGAVTVMALVLLAAILV